MKKVILLSAVALLSGCSSVMNGSSDDINVTTNLDATCMVGGQEFIAPGMVTVDSSGSDIMIQCKSSDGKQRGQSIVKSSVTTSALVGNIFLGGIPGYVVDFATGNAYNYPGHVSIPMRAAE